MGLEIFSRGRVWPGFKLMDLAGIIADVFEDTS